MLNKNLSQFKNDMYPLIQQTIKYNQPLNIVTDEGNVVMISENDYMDIMETLNVYSSVTMKSKIIEGINTPIEECISENEVIW